MKKWFWYSIDAVLARFLFFSIERGNPNIFCCYNFPLDTYIKSNHREKVKLFSHQLIFFHFRGARNNKGLFFVLWHFFTFGQLTRWTFGFHWAISCIKIVEYDFWRLYSEILLADTSLCSWVQLQKAIIGKVYKTET